MSLITKKKINSIGIIGCGALGLFFGTKLLKSKLDIRFLLRSDYNTVKENGVFINSVTGNTHYFVNTYKDPDELRDVDLIIVALKTTANDYLLKILKQIISPSTVVLTLQNGLGNEELISQVVHPDKIAGGVAFVCLNRTAPGVVAHTAYGHIKANGFTNNFDKDTLLEIESIFSESDIDFHIVDSILQLKWEKLLWNIPFNGISALLSGIDTLDIMTFEPLKNYARNIMLEVIKAAESDNINLNSDLIQKNLDYTLSMGPYKTSMYLDKINHRLLEVESIIGIPLHKAKENNITLPYMEAMYSQLKFYNEKVLRE